MPEDLAGGVIKAEQARAAGHAVVVDGGGDEDLVARGRGGGVHALLRAGGVAETPLFLTGFLIQCHQGIRHDAAKELVLPNDGRRRVGSAAPAVVDTLLRIGPSRPLDSPFQ